MSVDLNALRERLKLEQERANQRFSDKPRVYDSATYAFWKMDYDQSCYLRILPDADKTNPDYFWREILQINLNFKGVKGETDRDVLVRVPCVEMWKETCPILKVIKEQAWFDDPSMKELGSKYWKKKSYLFNFFVNQNPIKDDDQNPALRRRVTFKPQLYKVIYEYLINDRVQYMPSDPDHGRDLMIKKTKGARYDEYIAAWDMNERPMSDAERAALENPGPFNLSEFMPKKPSAEALVAMTEMFEASLNGEAYDKARWGQFYRPFGGADKDDHNQESSAVSPLVSVASVPAPVATPMPKVADAPKEVTKKIDTQALLDQIKAKRNKQ